MLRSQSGAPFWMTATSTGLLDLSLPGMDEVMALFELSECARAGGYAQVVVDTAPSGHTAHLFRLPEVFTRWIGALERMTAKHRYIVARFVRGARAPEDAVDLFLRDLTERVERVRALLFNAESTAFTLVTIPEAMSVEETVRYYGFLRRAGVPVTDLVINRVEQAREGCVYCRARAAGQEPWLARLAADEFVSLRPHRVPLLSREVRGQEALRSFGAMLWESPKAAAEEFAHAARDTPTLPRKEDAPDFLIAPCRLLIFGGKGGVGKTTSAAAAALAQADSDPQSRVLLFSTDPAHSLSDSFGETVGELKRGVAGRGNLDAMEIDPAARFEAFKGRFDAWTEKLFSSLTGNSRWTVQFEPEAMREIMALAPPGIDEIAALSAISDALEEDSYTCIILDTAPTGHLVRFLEMPGAALSWVHMFINLLLKYKDVVRWDGVAEELISLSRNIKRIMALLTNADDSEFIGVASPERMSLEETLRLTASLERLQLPMRRLLINNVVPSDAAADCRFCAARRESQEAAMRDFAERITGSVALYQAPQQPEEITGSERLQRYFSQWRPLSLPAEREKETV